MKPDRVILIGFMSGTLLTGVGVLLLYSFTAALLMVAVTVLVAGLKKGLKLVREHNSFEDILSATGADIPRWEEIENIFLNPDVFDPPAESLRFSPPQVDALVDYMCEQRGFSAERVQSALSRGYKVPEDANQSSLSKWV